MDPYLGEIRTVPWKTIPTGWAACNGQTLQISQNYALYSLLGTSYGGDGRTTFMLPNLNGRVIMGCNLYSSPDVVGTHGGATSVTLTQATLPPHQHAFQVSNAPGTVNTLPGNVYAEVATGQMLYGPMTAPLTAMSPDIIEPAGDGAPHNNMQPYLALTYIICVNGFYPPRAN